MKTVLHVIDSLDLGGAQEVVLNLATCGSGEFHHEVAALHGRGIYRQRLLEAGVRVHSLAPHRFFPLYLATLPALIARLRPRVVHAHLIPSNILAKPLAVALRVPAVVSHDHTNDSRRIDSKPLLALDRWANRFARHFIAVSASCRDFLVRHENIEPARISVVRNAIDLNRFDPRLIDRSSARKKLGLPLEGRWVAGVGRLNPQKNFALFLDVASRLARQFPGLRFLLAGNGPEESALKRRTHELGLEDRVVFSGYVADSRLVYRAADVLLMPSLFEGLPMTLLEAMAMDLPVVASRLDGMAEVLRDGQNGLLVASGDAEGFEHAVARLLEDDIFAGNIKHAARSTIEAGFSVEGMTQAVESVYHRLLA